MPRVNDAPSTLWPYQAHGVDIDYQAARVEAIGDCPFCQRSRKFYVNTERGTYQCWGCRTGTNKGGGNVYTFLEKLWELSSQQGPEHATLAEERRLLWPATLDIWGIRQSLINGEWLVPGYRTVPQIRGGGIALRQIYRYVRIERHGKAKYTLLPTPSPGPPNELGHELVGLPLYDPKKPVVYIAEGVWDAMALFEVLRAARLVDDSGSGETELIETGNEAESLYASASILAISSCNVFKDAWVPLLAGKKVVLLFDNDHPLLNRRTNQNTDPAARVGLRKITGLLARAGEDNAPTEVCYLNWVTDDCGARDHNPTLPHGYDVRDFLAGTPADVDYPRDLGARITQLEKLLGKVHPVPKAWVYGRREDEDGDGGSPGGGLSESGEFGIDCLPCRSWKVLRASWTRALRFTDGLDRALSVMLSAITSTMAVGDQLWVKIMGPPACGKSTMCEGLAVCRRYVRMISTIRGFHSGWRAGKGEAGRGKSDDDNTLIAQLAGKTLVTKDGDTLLQQPNRDQILSEGRDIYDTTASTSYRNSVEREYRGLRMTWIICGTSALRKLDSSEMGARFLDCVIMDTIDDDLEDEILWRVANRVERGMSLEADGKLETQHDPALVKALQLTGGYVTYLRANARELLDRVEMGEDALRRCVRLGKFVAYMRARPSKTQDETAEREFGTRLVSQMVRLAKCLAVVLGEREVGSPPWDRLSVMGRVESVALDTARGKTLELARHLYKVGPDGADFRGLTVFMGETDDKLKSLLGFLAKIRMVERCGGDYGTAWKLTDRLRELYEDVMTPRITRAVTPVRRRRT